MSDSTHYVFVTMSLQPGEHFYGIQFATSTVSAESTGHAQGVSVSAKAATEESTVKKIQVCVILTFSCLAPRMSGMKPSRPICVHDLCLLFLS